MQQRAVAVRRTFAEFETATYGQEWTVEDLVMGLLSDLGDLSSIIQTVEGKRPSRWDDPMAALEHELSDCFWVLFVLADRYGIDIGTAFQDTMTSIESWLATQPHSPG